MTDKKMTPEEKKQDWKDKYGKIYAYTVEDEDGKPVTAYFRQPSRSTVAAAQAEIARGNLMKYNETILKNSLLEANGDVLGNDTLFYGLIQKVDEIIGAKVGELKKL